MKRFFPALLILLCIAAGAAAQTNVVGTITDPNGIPYNLGTIRADLVPVGGPQPCAGTNPCITFQSGQTATLSRTGSFQMNLYPNSIITPGGTQWQFTVTEPGVPFEFGFGPQTFIYVVTVPNQATFDISAGLSALAPQLARTQTGPGTFPRLDQVLNPNVSKTFNLGGTTLAFSAGAFDLSGATSAKLPVIGGCTTSASGQICWDSTNGNWHIWTGADSFLATFPVASPPTSGDVVGFLKTSNAWSLQDLGPVNTTTGGSFLKINMTSPLDGDTPCYDASGPPIWNNCTAGVVGRAITGATSTDTIAQGDNVLTINHAATASASVTQTLPTATTLGIPNFAYNYDNFSSHADSIAPTTWTINGSATLSVPAQTSCTIWVDPNSATNWLGNCNPQTGGGIVTNVTASAPIVSSGGATPNISCPTCGTGTGNLSGTLTPGKVPVASGANSLADGAILDDTTHAARDNNGFDINSLGEYLWWAANNASPGTTANKMACDDGTGKAKICDHTTSTTNNAIGVAVAANGAAPGTTGNTGICIIGFCSVVFDNGATANHYAQESTSVDGDLSDVGTTKPTNGQDYYYIFSGNAGAGTQAIIRNLSPSELNASSISGGNGRATQIEVNGSITKNVANFVNGSGLALTPVNSGNTTTTTPSFTTQSAGDNTTNAATTAFVTTAINNAIAGVNPAVAVQAATTGVLPNSPTYSNGVSGVGATLTAGSAAALVIDGYTPVLLDRILVKNQASAFQNGVYFLSTLGTGIVPYVLTRALDFDQPSDINNTGAIPVVNGTTNGQTSWVVTSSVTTIGTDAITFTQFTLNPTTILTATSAATAANKLAVSGGANRTTSYIDLPDVKIIPAANCPNAVPGAGWSYATSTFTAACRAGSNNLGGALQLAPSTGGAAQFRVEIPTDWDSATQPSIRIEYGSGSNTTGTVIWTVASACTKADGSVTDDPAFNAESAFGTQTMAAANRAWSQTGQFTAITSGNNCVGGGGMTIKVTLSGTASSAINVYQAVLTVNRLPVVQAN